MRTFHRKAYRCCRRWTWWTQCCLLPAVDGTSDNRYSRCFQNSADAPLRYPDYRLPKDRLDEDIQAILETGVQVEFGKRIGKDITIQSLRQEYDAVLISIGASTDKKLGIEGEHAEGVISAVSFLRDVGEDKSPDLTGQEVAVIGGGNVSMDAVRTAKRLGAKK